MLGPPADVDSDGLSTHRKCQVSASRVFVIEIDTKIKVCPVETNLRTEGMIWKTVGSSVEYIQFLADRLQHAESWVWSFKIGTFVNMCLIQLGHAVEQGEMLCNPVRGRFDPVLLENFVLLFQVCLVNHFLLD